MRIFSSGYGKGGKNYNGSVIHYGVSATDTQLSRYNSGQYNTHTNGNATLIKDFKVVPVEIRFPYNPLNEFISRFRDTFSGCLRCRSV